MLENLKKLCSLDGISGREDAVQEEILRQIAPHCEFKIDNLGNVIAFKRGKQRPKNKLLLSAHMDEVGMLVTGITSDGMLRITTVGGIDPRVIIGRCVTVAGKYPGVIGTKAVHMQEAEERAKATPVDKLFVDIGAKDKEEAEQLIRLGETVCFTSEYREFGDGRIKAKAIDDRFGCAVLLELIRQELEYDTVFSFVTQEEVGLRGAKVASFGVAPDIALVLEATTAGDLAGVEGAERVCRLGGGPVVPFMDRATIYDKGLYDLAFSLAEQHGIPCQTKTKVAGGNDAGSISLSGKGARVVSISVPCRYLHSPSCVIDREDAENALRLARLFIDKAAEL